MAGSRAAARAIAAIAPAARRSLTTTTTPASFISWQAIAPASKGAAAAAAGARLPIHSRQRQLASGCCYSTSSPLWGGGHHGPEYDPPTGHLFGVRPGEKYQKEGWEGLFFYGFYGSIGLAVVAYIFKPDTSYVCPNHILFVYIYIFFNFLRFSLFFSSFGWKKGGEVGGKGNAPLNCRLLIAIARSSFPVGVIPVILLVSRYLMISVGRYFFFFYIVIFCSCYLRRFFLFSSQNNWACLA